ncbi:hypothetical protein QAD02_015116 [Eretmocerus hayati]|uniref:Uncharacterized protein n=1 Tax=Eretmocerus hayati TaxID=131215 RepID=A0ACC2P6Y5_9HYME|nr:hypothetical protein QAD02_015116 [Eretmocerus hayati]
MELKLGKMFFLLLPFFALCVSHPTSQIEPVAVATNQNNSSRIELENNSGANVVTLPLKITRDEIITLVTYAMRVMASRINVTLHNAEVEKLPAEKIEILRNSSVAIDRFLKKMSSEAQTRKDNKMKSANEIKNPRDADCEKNGRKNLKSGVNQQRPKVSVDIDKSFEVPTSKQKESSTFSKSPFSLGNSFAPFNSDFSLPNPYDNSANSIFRDPNVFPPFNIQQQQQQNIFPLPLHENLGVNLNGSPLSGIGMAINNGFMQNIDRGSSESIGSQSGSSKGSSGQHSPLVLAPQTEAMAKKDPKQQKSNLTSSTTRPILSVPFEAYITITRDSQPMLTLQPTTPKNPQKQNEKQNVDHDIFVQASTSDVPESLMLPQSMNSRNQAAKKEKSSNRSKTTVVLEEGGSAKDDADKKKKMNNKKPQPTVLQSLFRSLVLTATNNTSSPTTSTFSNIITALTRRPQNSKKVQDDGGGSLGSITDLLPLIIPILEDISDPESDTDLGEFLQAAIPILQGLSEPDPETGEGPDIIGIIGPIIQSLFLGKDGMGSDSGAILGPLVQLIGPFIGPLSGPLIAPLSSSSSGGQGSDLGALLSALLGPLSQPTDNYGPSIIAQLTTSIVAALSKELSSPDSGVDIGALVSQLVTGALSGTSAGLSGGSSKPSGGKYGPAPPAYGPPASQVELLQPPPRNQRPITFTQSPPPRSNSNTKRRSQNGNKRKSNNRIRTQASQPKPQTAKTESPPQISSKQSQVGLTPQQLTQQQLSQQKLAQQQLLTQYQFEQLASPAGYGSHGVPAYGVDPLDTFGKAFKDILSSGVNLFTAVLSASTASSGASGASSSDSGGHEYGPPAHAGYGYG